TIRLNETLGAPSARAMKRLMAAIEADEAVAPTRRVSFNIGGWLSNQIAQLSRRTLAWSGAAAALAIVLQAGVITGLFMETPADSGPKGPEPNGTIRGFNQGTYVVVQFSAQATAIEITDFLAAHKAMVVDGPRPKGIFRVRIAATTLSKDEL